MTNQSATDVSPGPVLAVGKRLNPSWRIALWVLLLLSGAEFLLRGPVRYLHPTNWNDLAQYYASSRTWVRGQNFANPEYFVAMWRNEVGENLDVGTARVHIAPPPGALVLFAPIAALSWPTAKLAWLAVLLASFIVIVLTLTRIGGFELREERTLAFIVGCLALAPFHTDIAAGNQTIFVVALCTAGMWQACAKHDAVAGLLFGTACSLKPHIAAFLVLYYLVKGRWRLFLSAVGITVILVIIAAGRMHFAGVEWFPDYLNNIKFSAAKNKVDDFTVVNPIRFMLINLQVPFYSFTHDARSANLLAFTIGTVLIMVWLILVVRNRTERSELLALSAIAVIGLLPVYHRLYDASILAIPLCWALSQRANWGTTAKYVFALIVPFAIPGAALLQQGAWLGYIPAAWTRWWGWERIVMPHETWILLALSIVLLHGMAKRTTESATRVPARVN